MPYRWSMLFLICLAGLAPISRADTSKPPMLNDVGIDQKLGVQVPADLQFRDEEGKPVRLGDYYNDKRPIILALVYYKCPMLCTMVLNDLTRSLNGITMNSGEDFEVVAVSFDPKEGPDLAFPKKQEYLKHYKQVHGEKGWHFLTGPQESITELTKTVGFRYAWDEKNQMYAHASGIIILTPQGKTSRYFFGIDYAPSDLRLSLDEASGGKITSAGDQVLLYCFHYDPSTGKYSVMVTRLLQLVGVITMTALGGYVLTQVLKGHHHPPAGAAGA